MTDDEWNQARRAVKQRQSGRPQLQPSQSSLPSMQGWSQQQAQPPPQFAQPSQPYLGQFQMHQASLPEQQYQQQMWGPPPVQPMRRESAQQSHYFGQAAYYTAPQSTSFASQIQYGHMGQVSGQYGYVPSVPLAPAVTHQAPPFGTPSESYHGPSGFASSASQGYGSSRHQAPFTPQQSSEPGTSLEQLPPPPEYQARARVDGYYSDEEAVEEIAKIEECLKVAKSVDSDVSDLYTSIDQLRASLPSRQSNSLVEQVGAQRDDLRRWIMKKKLHREELKSLEKRLKSFRSKKQTGRIPIADVGQDVKNFLAGCQWKLRCCQIIESNLMNIAQSLQRR